MSDQEDVLRGVADALKRNRKGGEDQIKSLLAELGGLLAEAERGIDRLDTERGREAIGKSEQILERLGLTESGLEGVAPDMVPVKKRLLAKLEAVTAMIECGVSRRTMLMVMSIGPDHQHPDKWAQISAELFEQIREQGYADAAVSDSYLTLYTQMAVIRELSAEPGDSGVAMSTTDANGLREAAKRYYSRFIAPLRTKDYAHGDADLLQRVRLGANDLAYLSPEQRLQWRTDVENFRSAAARHEYTQRDVNTVLELIDQRLREIGPMRVELDAEIARLERLARAYRHGPSHLQALEEQWRAYRFNAAIQLDAERAGMGDLGALQGPTIAALRVATAYCWSPTPVEAVAAAAESLQPDVMPTGWEILGDLGAPAAAGWWWFEEPIPVQTLISSGEEAPVVALLWRRELSASGKPRTWFTTFVMNDSVPWSGAARDGRFPTPTTSWIWSDDVPLGQLEERLRRGYDKVTPKSGAEAAGMDVTVAASVWFSKFFLASGVWLRQRIAVTSRGQGTRQVSRQIAREHNLTAPPVVEIVALRRNEVAIERSTQPSNREFSCRWIVHGFWRNQFYPSTGKHNLKWIDSYIKGPADKPLKTAARIYAVTR